MPERGPFANVVVPLAQQRDSLGGGDLAFQSIEYEWLGTKRGGVVAERYSSSVSESREGVGSEVASHEVQGSVLLHWEGSLSVNI